MTKLNHVDSVLANMIKAWPTLRGSRLDCLHHIATLSPGWDARWNEDGTLSIDEGKTTNNYPVKTEDEDADVIRYRAEGDDEQLASRLLWLRSEAVKEAFNRDNAENIIAAGDRYDPAFKDYPNAYGWENTIPSGGYRLLENIPENADRLWVKAFVGMLEEILHFKYPEHKFTRVSTDAAARYISDLDNAKTEARAALVRLKGTDLEKIELARRTVQAKIDALLKEAGQLGVAVEATIK